MLARTRPLGPTMRLWSISEMFPSTSPSRYRSSLPESSPRMITDLPICAISLAKSLERAGSKEGRGGVGIEGVAVGVVIGFASLPGVDFHIRYFSLVELLVGTACRRLD